MSHKKGGTDARKVAVGTGDATFDTSKIANILNGMDETLLTFPIVVKTADTVGIRPSVMAIGAGFFLVMSLGFGWGGGIICDLVGFLYPAYMSFKAIETPGREDDKLWLTYWVVYAFFSLLEYFIDIILFWVPFYYLLKLAFLLYLYLPFIKGAEVVYNKAIRPYLLQHENRIDTAIDGCVGQIKQTYANNADQIRQTVDEGINLVNQAATVIKRR